MTATALQEIEVATPRRKWPCYPDYKPTGLPWLPKAPTHWSAKRLRYVVRFPTKGEVRGLPLDTLVSFVPMEAIGEYGGLSLDQTRPIEEVLNGYTYFRDGDVVVAKITPCFENGKGALAEGLENGLGFGTTELHVLRPGAEILPKYLFYLTLGEHFRKLGTAEMYGAGGQKRVPEQFIQNLKHPLPPLDEQRAIAAFLDRETARIDELIAKKQRLIELLKEKRQAVISRAVTKGLNPNAPLKPTGIDWLGDVPAHWAILRVKHIARVGNGSTPSRENAEYWYEGHYPWLNSFVVNSEVVTEAEQFVTDIALRECHLPRVLPPAVLVGITGEGKTRGMATTLLMEATVNQHLAFLKPKSELCDVFFLRRVLDIAYQFLRDDSDGGGSTKGAITCEQLGNLSIPLPPLPEQKQISSLLDDQSKRIAVLVDESETAIGKLREYRSSLITAAVTGQIDVRQYGKEAT